MFLRFFACLFVILVISPVFAQDEPNEVIARVNGVEVTRDEVATAIMQLPAEYQQVPMEVLFEPILQQVIDRKLLAEAATANGVEDSPEYNQQISLLREDLLQQLYLQSIVDDGLSEEALNEAYQQYLADYDAEGGGEEVHARHILVASEEEAQALVERLDAGEDFATLAQETSIGPSGPDGGDLGFFKKEAMVPEFGEAAFALEPGETSGPVESPFGWHVIRVEERRSAPPPELAEVAGQLSNEIAQTIVSDEIDRLRGDADIEILLPEPEAATETDAGTETESEN